MAPAAFDGERLGPAGPAGVVPGPLWSLVQRMHPVAGSGASKKLQRRQPEPALRPACTRTVEASCLKGGERWASRWGHPLPGGGGACL